jgi:transcriptional regulator with XRE-family HTH domain
MLGARLKELRQSKQLTQEELQKYPDSQSVQ